MIDASPKKPLEEIGYLIVKFLTSGPKHCGEVARELRLYNFLIAEKPAYGVLRRMCDMGLLDPMKSAGPDTGHFNKARAPENPRKPREYLFAASAAGKLEICNLQKYLPYIKSLSKRREIGLLIESYRWRLLERINGASLRYAQLVKILRAETPGADESAIAESINHLLFEKLIIRTDSVPEPGKIEQMTPAEMKKYNPVLCITFYGVNRLKYRE